VEASNSCAGTLIFGSFFFIVFCQSFFFPPLFAFFFWLSVLLSYSFLLLSNWFLFYRLSFSLFFFDIVLFMFAHVVSSLAYPNLLRTKRLGCCCCCNLLQMQCYCICLAFEGIKDIGIVLDYDSNCKVLVLV
jgi:hypothetical protein